LAKDLNALNNAKNIDAAKDKQLNSILSSGIQGVRPLLPINDRNRILSTATGAPPKTTNAVANNKPAIANIFDNLKKINTELNTNAVANNKPASANISENHKKINTKLNTNATPKTSANTGTKTNSSANVKSSVAAKPLVSTSSKSK
jgi:hypothetical protein